MIIPALIVLAIIILSLSIVLMWKKSPQDKAIVVTGLRKRVISGGGGFVVPLLERIDRISLENIKLEVRTDGALTEQGVEIKADGVAVIKVKSDMESILSAIEQFNTGTEQGTIEVIRDTAKHVLEGKLREIISKLTVEDIYKDREKFASNVQSVAASDLADMGLEIKAFTIRDIKDDNGYLEALGKKRIAEVKKDAEIAEAESKRDAKIKTAEANRLGEQARLTAETQIAESEKDKDLKVQAYRKDKETEKAKADLAYEIEQNKVKKEVTETEMAVELLRREKQIELAERDAIKREKELEASIRKDADAQKYKFEKEAEANKFKEIQDAEARARSIELEGLAKAKAVREEGKAEAEIIKEKGNAEAEAMMKKAEAFKMYNEAAVTQMIIEKLPQIAKAVAEPLAKTEKIVIVDSGGNNNGAKGAGKVTGYVTDIMAQLPETVNALTGIDLNEVLKGYRKKEAENADIQE
ncbi:flotillin family protein [Alkaliphilus peptidifermentans]|uniref:Flotillin n=1 Tax=Alkaliphilus peptidifermentans DSM 18978 TaxID=1120976 RepID=A0A1G5KZ40_9FIRM|nr:SPFH domain-containing protein [Alkaliphilus peptidifermentans]SCZ05867.1 flotillin [Alkaliphilus peptidifermentans DSM 18978]